MKIVPADDAIADLKKKTAEYEEQAKKQGGKVAARFRDTGSVSDWPTIRVIIVFSDAWQRMSASIEGR
jgi:hypothetical protein